METLKAGSSNGTVAKVIMVVAGWALTILSLGLYQQQHLNTQLQQELQELREQSKLTSLYKAQIDELAASHKLHEQTVADLGEKFKMAGEASLSRRESLGNSQSADPEVGANPRSLGGFKSGIVAGASNTEKSGCITLSATEDFDMNSATCKNGNRCPPCFIASGHSTDIELSVVKCSTGRMSSAVAMQATDLMAITFVNDGVLTRKDG
eukprot:gnl/TRDRNA2_/TRDRNA2_175014_c0_seq2.p1 gnl/TRDRNA2_/TRDRNA2_175014_c0~~gnl/TRDRNA2_/TRDRNA2_175014_c0_seq2.p1  ORF type:complete len:209 (-),score=42.64 gnl/TRDRNA2_/TRDRNA2_175014_c0_seq2:56-682(-)